MRPKRLAGGICEVEGCGLHTEAKGLCHKHYNLKRYHERESTRTKKTPPKGWHQEAQAMRERGASYDEIADHFGVTTPTAYRAANPERRARYNRRSAANPERQAQIAAWAEAHRGVCEICGAQTGRQSIDRCLEHYRERERARQRRQAIADMWAAGASMPEIREALGISKQSLGGEMARMRRAGWDLPHRYNVVSRTLEKQS